MKKLGVLFLCTTLALSGYHITEEEKLTSDHTWQQSVYRLWLKALLQVNGESSILTHPAVLKSQDAANAAIEHYHYQDNTLILSFSTQAVHHFLRSIDAAIWAEPRPTLYVWLTNEATPPFKARPSTETMDLEKLAEQRKLPIKPLTLTSAQSQWCLEQTQLHCLEALKHAFPNRYIAWGTQQKRVIQWILIHHDQTWAWHNNTVPSLGVHQAIDQIAKTHNQTPMKNHLIHLKILGIPSYQIHQKLIANIQNMADVADVNVTSLSTDETEINLTSHLSPHQLSRALQSLHLLAFNQEKEDQTLTFTWAGSS